MKYLVSETVTVSAYTEVEANSEDEAKAIAASRSLADISIDGSWPMDECWHIDNDGTPEVNYAEETK